jgi:hypothetical protein
VVGDADQIGATHPGVTPYPRSVLWGVDEVGECRRSRLEEKKDITDYGVRFGLIRSISGAPCCLALDIEPDAIHECLLEPGHVRTSTTAFHVTRLTEAS